MTDDNDPNDVMDGTAYSDEEARENFTEAAANADAIFMVAARWHELTEEEAEEYDDVGPGDTVPQVMGGRYMFDSDDLTEAEEAEIMLRCLMEAHEQAHDIDPSMLLSLALDADDDDLISIKAVDAEDIGLADAVKAAMGVDPEDDEEGNGSIGYH